jgi:3-dehydroquinate synthase class II
MSVDGTPISQADLARIEAEEKLHAEQQRRAVQVIAAASNDVDDCRMLLSILGLGADVVAAARRDLRTPVVAAAPAAVPTAEPAPAKRPRKRSAAA